MPKTRNARVCVVIKIEKTQYNELQNNNYWASHFCIYSTIDKGTKGKCNQEYNHIANKQTNKWLI